VHTRAEHGNTPEAQQFSVYCTLIMADQRIRAQAPQYTEQSGSVHNRLS